MIDLTRRGGSGYLALMRKQQLATIFLAAPTSPDVRLKRIVRETSGFVYAVSRTGVTGAQQQLADDAKLLVSRLRKFTRLPIAIGFGIASPQQFQQAGEFADAVAVGSAIVKIVEEYGNKSPGHVAKFIVGLTGNHAGAGRARG